MATVKFNNQELLKRLQARILLETNISLTQQEILELSIDLVSENIDLILKKIKIGCNIVSDEQIKSILQLSSDWGEGTEDSSKSIDEHLYK